MSKLRKVLRALQHSEEWREVLEAASMIVGKEVTRDLQVKVTMAVADQIVFNEDTLEIDVSGVDEEALLQAVAAYEPPAPEPAVTPELERRISTLEARLEQVDTLSEDMSELRSALDRPNLTPKPGLGILN